MSLPLHRLRLKIVVLINKNTKAILRAIADINRK